MGKGCPPHPLHHPQGSQPLPWLGLCPCAEGRAFPGPRCVPHTGGTEASDEVFAGFPPGLTGSHPLPKALGNWGAEMGGKGPERKLWG